METIFPILIGVAALIYILTPLLGGAAPFRVRSKNEALVSGAQIELDAELGKIDDAERADLDANIAAQTPREAASGHAVSVEALIRGARSAKRVELDLESEILVARARRKHLN